MILIDYSDRRPIYEQVTGRIAELIIQGALAADSQLPSVRSLAMELSINPNTIQRAYQELERRGYIYSIKGKGSFISPRSSYAGEQEQEILAELRRLLERAVHLGMDLSLFKNMILQYEGGNSQ